MSSTGRIDVWGQRAQVINRFGEVDEHAHAVGTLLVALDQSFELRTAELPWTYTPAAYVPPGCRHALRVHHQRIAVILLAPGRLELQGFARAQGFCPWSVHLLPQHPELEEFLGACWDDKILAADVQARFAKLVGCCAPRQPSTDDRICQMVSDLKRSPGNDWSAQQRAMVLGVERSRARELLREHIGVSWQALRRWERMRALSGLLAQGHTLTRAAHELGFSDSSQLTRDFRATFGVAPGKLYQHSRVMLHPGARGSEIYPE